MTFLGYESLSQQQDYSKGTYGAASQNQVKGVSGKDLKFLWFIRLI